MKPHYIILDGLRGVAALMVLFFHIFEAFATSHLDQKINHGYLAVDFFFILSGFVVGYAYDGRLKVGEFFKKRLIRLHPMVIVGALVGTLAFWLGDQTMWKEVGIGVVLAAFALNSLVLPAPPAVDMRGWGEMFPLNGPTWSLWFEYLANVLYILVLRKFSTRALAGVVVATGCGLAAFAILGPQGDVAAGWDVTARGFMAGTLRVMFPFSAGLLLCRIFGRTSKSSEPSPANPDGLQNKLMFWICSALVVIFLAMPRLGGAERLWLNGLYDILCIAAIFPLVVWLGAAGGNPRGATTRICKFLGELSYPLYLVHYPFIYLYYAWVKTGGLTFGESLPGAAAVVVGSIALAWVCLKLYDEPVRKYFTARLKGRKN